MQRINRFSASVAALMFMGITFCSCDSKPDDKRKVYLLEDKKKVTDTPDQKTDSISYFLKECVNRTLTGIKTDELKYFSKEKNDTVLVIVKVGDMKGIEKSSRKELLFAVEDCLKAVDYFKNKKIYIDVEGRFNTLLVKTPVKADLDGKFADSDLILPFYGKNIIPNKETK
ncbi:hypothetical protein PQ462_08005 [Flavobacterium sp. KACC 22758]|jgi:hypothetical protein|uniref:hypothetical protein n=1 Tax=Flavobacterium sp. KACC 22758 TaxID=3025667 RepID=UPI0023654C83|nr:hypothetical protein [Flavobacterium sp. KACC 22758]WDF61306.1 hypothetical protein PQ462_08005 [Flavobacterium sp. KACC 22758]